MSGTQPPCRNMASPLVTHAVMRVVALHFGSGQCNPSRTATPHSQTSFTNRRVDACPVATHYCPFLPQSRPISVDSAECESDACTPRRAFFRFVPSRRAADESSLSRRLLLEKHMHVVPAEARAPQAIAPSPSASYVQCVRRRPDSEHHDPSSLVRVAVLATQRKRENQSRGRPGGARARLVSLSLAAHGPGVVFGRRRWSDLTRDDRRKGETAPTGSA
jgi:hypothetical protein